MTEAQLAQQQLDQHAGHGGSYVIDPKTGDRTLVERTKQVGDPGHANAGSENQDQINAEQVVSAQSTTADDAVSTKKQPKEKQ